MDRYIYSLHWMSVHSRTFYMKSSVFCVYLLLDKHKMHKDVNETNWKRNILFSSMGIELGTQSPCIYQIYHLIHFDIYRALRLSVVILANIIASISNIVMLPKGVIETRALYWYSLLLTDLYTCTITELYTHRVCIIHRKYTYHTCTYTSRFM